MTQPLFFVFSSELFKHSLQNAQTVIITLCYNGILDVYASKKHRKNTT